MNPTELSADELLDTSASMVETQGLYQGDLAPRDHTARFITYLIDGPIGPLAALGVAETGDPERRGRVGYQAIRALADHVNPGARNSVFRVNRWIDAPGRTTDQVVTAMRQAAHRLRTTLAARVGGVVGLGYEGLDVPGFLTTVTSAGVQMVVDVRLTPLSRKPGFSKRSLADALTRIGVTYRHEPALGNPKENRPGFAQPEPARSTARARYTALLADPGPTKALTRVRDASRTSRIGLLCFEADQTRCHRDLILSRLTGLVTGLPGLSQNRRAPHGL